MSEVLVVTLTFVVSYALIGAYAGYLHLRRRRVGS
jgi:hypothetical protein